MPDHSPRALRLGVAGPVGTGKSSLIATICRILADEIRIGVITNDIYTDEDARFLRSAGVLDPERIVAVETGACPHTAIREDPSANLAAARRLCAEFDDLDIILIESGGDNLAATFTSDLVDYWIFVIDTAGGDDIPRKKGIGLLQADLLVVNKIDLAELVGADLDGMRRDCAIARPVKPTVFTDLRAGAGLEALTDELLRGVMLTART